MSEETHMQKQEPGHEPKVGVGKGLMMAIGLIAGLALLIVLNMG